MANIDIEIKESGSQMHISVSDEDASMDLEKITAVALERGLLIACASQLFVIPTAAVERTLVIRTDQIVNVQGGQAIILEGCTIPLRLLANTLQINHTTLIAEDSISIVIIKQDENVMAFIVNEIIGEREIVSKNLSPSLSRASGVIGGTLLEDDQVAVVLEPKYLLTQGLQPQIHSTVIGPKSSAKTSEKIRILVVDDSITTRTLEKSILENHHYDVTVAVNGKEAWNILQQQSFSLLITDVMMPIMDGFTLTEHVKKSEKLANLPVIIITSMGSDAEKKRGIEVGADAYIIKNEFESDMLLEVISRLINCNLNNQTLADINK